MQIDLYTVSWNEGDVLEFFFRHYDPIVDRYVIYDDGSSDNTIPQLRAHPKVEIRSFKRELADSFVLSHQKMQNESWKEARETADWIIVTAIDEHLLLERTDLKLYLAECKAAGVTAIPAIGYQMISEQFPQPGELLCKTRTLGAPSVYMNKLSIFDPSAIADTGFGLGRHQSLPSGNVRFPARDELMLFHYKRLSFEHTFSRHVDLGQRLGKIDRANGWGAHYHLEREKLAASWDDLRQRAIDLTRPGFVCSECYEAPLWWRQYAS